MSAFSLVIFVGILTSFRKMLWKFPILKFTGEFRLYHFFLHSSSKMSMREWFLHFTTHPKKGLPLSARGSYFEYSPADIYLVKVNKRNTRTRYEICSKLAIKTQELRHWCFYCYQCFIIDICFINVAATNIGYFVTNKFSRSLVHKINFTSIRLLVFKLA